MTSMTPTPSTVPPDSPAPSSICRPLSFDRGSASPRVQFSCAGGRLHLQTLQQVFPFRVFGPAHPLQIRDTL